MIVLGLTGSIGMGKSTAAAMFRSFGVPTYDADAAVRQLYAKGGAAVGPIGARWPGAIEDGAVNRAKLSPLVLGDAEAMAALEAIVHPLTGEARERFLDRHRETDRSLVVLDIPLLFETGGEKFVDRVAVVTAPPEIQRRRVLARPGMTPEKFEAILARQTPDIEKRRRADYIIETGLGRAHARTQVKRIIQELRG